MTVTHSSVESTQLAQVADLAARYGLLWHHCADSRRCRGTRGLPDLILAGPGGVAFRELKSSPHSVTSDQTTWRWMLRAAGVDVGLWLPSHGRNGDVEAQIAALARA